MTDLRRSFLCVAFLSFAACGSTSDGGGDQGVQAEQDMSAGSPGQDAAPGRRDMAMARADGAATLLDAGAMGSADGGVAQPDGGIVGRTDVGVTADAGNTMAPKRCEPEPAEGHLYTMTARSLTQGEEVSMCDYQGQAMLIVNTAANCGFTPQFEQLEALNRSYRDRPLAILGFLSNDFNNQGGTLEEVERCTDEYMIHFEQFYHVGVTSNSRDTQHPVFAWLINQIGFEGEIPWNFSKFLVSHDGRLLQRWTHFTPPDDPNFLAAVEAAVDAAPLAQ